MYTLKINIISFLASWSSVVSKSSVSMSSPNEDKKRSPKKQDTKEDPSENDLSTSPTENDSIYYLPVHLM